MLAVGASLATLATATAATAATPPATAASATPTASTAVERRTAANRSPAFLCDDAVAYLENPTLKSQIWIVGTAHISNSSAQVRLGSREAGVGEGGVGVAGGQNGLGRVWGLGVRRGCGGFRRGGYEGEAVRRPFFLSVPMHVREVYCAPYA